MLVQHPFDTKAREAGCRKITAERIRRVINGYSYMTPTGEKEKVEGLNGSFTFAKIGAVLFGEYREMGEKFPPYEELARSISYTETSREFDAKKMNEKTGKIGEHAGTSYYLLYTPEGNHDRALDLKWLAALDKTEKNRQLVVYCEKIWIHRDDLAKYEAENGRKVGPMLVPFNLK